MTRVQMPKTSGHVPLLTAFEKFLELPSMANRNKPTPASLG